MEDLKKTMSDIRENVNELKENVSENMSAIKKTGRRGVANVLYGRTIMVLLMIALQFLALLAMMDWYRDYVAFTYGGYSLVTIIVVLVIMNNDENPIYKIAWLIPIIAFPVFGILLYIWVKTQPMPKLIKKRLESAMLETLPYNPQDKEIAAELENADKGFWGTARYLYHTVDFPVYKDTQTTYFPLGEDKFKQMLIELEKAEKYIFMEYFILAEGEMWDAVLEILKRKVKEGVEVRLMYDGMCSLTLLPYSYPKYLESYGIKCRMFAPVKPVLSIHQNNRDHRKILVIDGKVAFTGGVNISDEYINRKSRFGHWKDTAIMLKGSAVNSFTLMFLQMWNINCGTTGNYDKYILKDACESLKKADVVKGNSDTVCSNDDIVSNNDVVINDHKISNDDMTGSDNSISNSDMAACDDAAGSDRTGVKGYVIPYGDTPFDGENIGEHVYMDMLNQASRYVHIMTPYLILDNEMKECLKYAAKRGVEVIIIMPHIPDKKYAFFLARSYYSELIRAGVKIYEYLPGFVHAKIFVSDDSKATVGSINLDFRSLYLHFECGVYMLNTDSVDDIEQDFQVTLEQCQEITQDFIKRLPLWQRMTGSVLKIFAPFM